MIDDIDRLADGTTISADICIIGAGAAGLLLARSLAESGIDVVVLESGGWSIEHETSSLSAGQSEPGLFRGLEDGRSRVFGGTTALWGGQCIRLDRIDFEHRPWVPYSGWPIGADALAPWYDAAEMALEILPDDSHTPAWNRFGLAPLTFDPACLLPVHGVFIRRPDFAARFRAELKASRSVRVLLHATVQSLSTSPAGNRIEGVEIASLGGRRATVRAPHVVLCAGAIENARLLLLSDAARPNGLGNDHDQVGRYLQDHPCGRGATVQTEAPRVLQDHYNMLYGRGTRYLPKIALSESAQRRHGLLNCVGRLAYDYDAASGTRALIDLLASLRAHRMPEALAGRLGAIGRGLPEIVESLWRVRVKGLSPAPRPSRIFLELFSEQTPDPDSRVTLDSRTDAFGLRQVRVDWRLDALTGRTLTTFTRIVAQEFERLGLGRVSPESWLDELVPTRPAVVDSYHPAGTTRMALRPQDGVVDTDGQVFGVSGLHVTGSSVFPTSGAANPTLTIAAMALRLADRLKTVLAGTRHGGTAPAIRQADLVGLH